jgi:hypothetical protein
VPESCLALAAEIYEPFDLLETKRLRTYVQDVADLITSSFFQTGSQTLTLSFSMGHPLTTRLDYPGEEAVRAVVGLFRQLYNRHEPTSFGQTLKLLRRHVRGDDAPYRDAALTELKELRRWEREALRPRIGLTWTHLRPDRTVASREEFTPEILIDLFLHGHYLHKGNAKSDKLDDWPLADAARQSFFGAMTALTQVYSTGANVVREVLNVPALLDAPSNP